MNAVTWQRLVVLLAMAISLHAGDVAAPRLNVVVILVDDLGWRDAGFMGSTQMRTPAIDRLAREGVTFSAAYSSAPNCAPTRACLLTGQYTPRHGVYTVYDERHTPGKPWHRILSTPTGTALPDSTITLAEALKARGYATGIFGMWNLGTGKSGPGTPAGQGFDQYLRPRDSGFDNDRYWTSAEAGSGKELTAMQTDAAIAFAAQHRNAPFFLYLPFHAVHAPWEADPKDVAAITARGDRGPAPAEYVATVETVDRQVARLVDALRTQGVLDHTVIVYTSDNGGSREYGAPLRGGKGELYEGGIRVPLAIWGAPGAKAGHQASAPTLSMDLYPTILELTGTPAPANQKLDGISLVPCLRGGNTLDRQAVFWHFPCYVGRQSPGSAMRQGDYKLIEWFDDAHVELYDLAKDPGETTDLAKSQPDLCARLHARLSAWQRETNAPTPREPNPAFDPAARSQGGGKGDGKGGGEGKGDGKGGGKGGGKGKGQKPGQADGTGEPPGATP